MESESAALVPPLYPVDLSPLLAESSGGTFTLEPFTVEDRLDDELFKAAVQVRIDRTNRGVRIVGTVRGSQEGACGRCLAPATAQLSAPIDEEALLTLDERTALLRSVIDAELGAASTRVQILSASNLAVRVAAEAGATLIIRGLRAGSDFEAELRMAHANRLLAPEIETAFLMTAPEHASTSSRLVREVARYGGPLDRLVPAAVVPVLTAAARRRASKA